ILARCSTAFVALVIKGQVNHDLAFGIEVNPCVIEITIGKTIWYLQFHFVCDKLFTSIWITSFDFMRLANQHNYITGGFLL
ncbi:hypothetical protein, partial [Frisingicoccus sp.]|uniref:hypothetical protein n=1 Tax=Frisingicoccus sp. TaxID=1918627 RepID=UPI003AB68127